MSSASPCPHHHVATDGSASSSPSSARQRPGRKASSAGVSTSPLPSAFATATLPARTACTRPATPSEESLRSESGSQKTIVDAAQQHVHALETAERLQVQHAVAHGEVAALDQREAEVARQVRVLEVGLVVGAGGEQRDVRVVALARARASAGCRAAAGRSRRGARPGSRGRPPRACATRRCGSPARSPRRTAPACGPPAPTTDPSARARDPQRRAGATRPAAAAARDTAAGRSDARRRAPAAAANRAAAAAVRRDRRGSRRGAARAAPARCAGSPTRPAPAPAGSDRAPRGDPCRADRRRRCR